jgi:hypothetical protein
MSGLGEGENMKQRRRVVLIECTGLQQCPGSTHWQQWWRRRDGGGIVEWRIQSWRLRWPATDSSIKQQPQPIYVVIVQCFQLDAILRYFVICHVWFEFHSHFSADSHHPSHGGAMATMISGGNNSGFAGAPTPLMRSVRQTTDYLTERWTNQLLVWIRLPDVHN